ncbi:hypothetical protein ACFV9C_42995 [Kribbella sp. NPDC059898]|uniref:hypothetical protein n=1 Tax=Kribbella sp. NPDC059898 TaxID=3346995 RepID=UPI003665EAA7
MEWPEVCEIARSLAGVKEYPTDGALRWTIGGRLVARRLDEQSLVVRMGFARREILLQQYPEALFVPPRFDAHQKVVVRIDLADPGLISLVLREAWTLQTSY